jgi:hypothetical protein
MTVGKKEIIIGFSITFVLGIILVIIYFFQKNKKKPVDKKIEERVISVTNDLVKIPNDPTTPSIYGGQPGVKIDGEWRVKPGFCNILVSGIIDWDRIRALPQADKDKLYDDLDNCRLQSLPLIQP